jgi:hypothetical protein
MLIRRCFFGGKATMRPIRKAVAYFWRAVLLFLSSVAILALVVLVVITAHVHHDTTVKVIRRANITTTITMAPRSAPSVILMIALLAIAVVFFLTAIFFESISKISIAGIGEIDIKTAATLAGEAAEATGGKRDQAIQIFNQVAPQVAVTQQVLKQPALAAAEASVFKLMGVSSTNKKPLAALMESLVEKAARETKPEAPADKNE